jgi:hypothetical protein
MLHELVVPWYWGALVVLLMVLPPLGVVVARKGRLSTIAATCAAFAILISMLWPLTWYTRYSASFGFTRPVDALSYHHWDLWFESQHGSIGINLDCTKHDIRGPMTLAASTRPATFRLLTVHNYSNKPYRTPSTWVKALGFSAVFQTWKAPTTGTTRVASYGVGLPHWAVLLLCLPFPLLWLRGFRQRRYRLRHGLCLSCGYDLRESPEKCPECGAKIHHPATATSAAAVGAKA